MINLLITFDVFGWCYENRAIALAKNSPPDFRVTIAPWTEKPSTDGIDLVFQLDSACTQRLGSCPHVLSWNSDPNRRGDRWQHAYESCDFLLMNNKATYEAHGREPRTCCIANGIDTDIFRVLDPIEGRRERVFWTGSRNPKKQKGFSIIEAAESALETHGFEIAAYPVESAADKPFTVDGMVEQYNSAGYCLCLSESDSTPNTSIEGMACGCALVSTRVGNVLEFYSNGPSGENCILIDRSVEGLIDGLLRAREKRVAIATAGAELMRTKWAYGPPANRAAVFYELFRRILRDGAAAIQPFSYDELE